MAPHLACLPPLLGLRRGAAPLTLPSSHLASASSLAQLSPAAEMAPDLIRHLLGLCRGGAPPPRPYPPPVLPCPPAAPRRPAG
ncbi:hypothetical protein U9M48_012337 [Paspalum notatum var. saurae]|uniref:Uncharacterized protein n=1 Tax=Paspalum notatum var. saurae TaxID=547442 RepID=A0AAQ3SXD7_PASNO